MGRPGGSSADTRREPPRKRLFADASAPRVGTARSRPHSRPAETCLSFTVQTHGRASSDAHLGASERSARPPASCRDDTWHDVTARSVDRALRLEALGASSLRSRVIPYWPGDRSGLPTARRPVPAAVSHTRGASFAPSHEQESWTRRCLAHTPPPARTNSPSGATDPTSPRATPPGIRASLIVIHVRRRSVISATCQRHSPLVIPDFRLRGAEGLS